MTWDTEGHPTELNYSTNLLGEKEGKEESCYSQTKEVEPSFSSTGNSKLVLSFSHETNEESNRQVANRENYIPNLKFVAYKLLGFNCEKVKD